MRNGFFLAGLLLSGSAAAQMSVADSEITLQAPQQSWQAYSKVQLWAAYDAIPLRDFASTWSSHYTPREGRNVFLQRDRVELGAEKNGWRVGLEYRVEISLEANHDSVEIYHLYQQRRDPDSEKHYAVDAHMKSWAAGGMRVGRIVTLPATDAGAPLLMVSGALYGNARNRDGDASGTMGYTPAEKYRFDAQYFNSNSKYQYPFMPEAEQKSSGASVSAVLQWPLTSQLTANLAVNDLWSRMHWSKLPSIVKLIHSEVRTVDGDGYINYQPQIYGQSSLIDHTGTIGASTALNLTYTYDHWSLRAGAERIYGTTIGRVSGSYRSAWGVFGASYDARFNMLGFGYDLGPLRMRIQANRLPLTESSAFGAELGLRYAF